MKQYQINRVRHGPPNARRESLNILSKERKEFSKKIKKAHEDILSDPELGKSINYGFPGDAK